LIDTSICPDTSKTPVSSLLDKEQSSFEAWLLPLVTAHALPSIEALESTNYFSVSTAP
jgi:hypothetical protein